VDITYTIMIPVLEWIARICHSYGWAILILTLIIRVCVWPLVNSSTRSMQRMSQLQPKLKTIQSRYKENPELLQKKLMEFYKKNKINPMGGCLPTLIQLPFLFALFATFTGPPFQDKAIPVKVNLVAIADESKAQLHMAPSSGANSPYVAKNGELAKLVVKPGDEVALFGKDENGKITDAKKEINYRVVAVEGAVPPDFKPEWKIGSDSNAATIAPGTGEAAFPCAGEVTVGCELPGKKVIGVPIKIVPRGKEEGEIPLIGGLFPRDSFREKTEHSSEEATIVLDGKSHRIAISPGPSTVASGARGVRFQVRTLDGSPLPDDFRVTWHVLKDPNAASIDGNGHAVLPRPGEILINAMITGEAKNERFYFVTGIGKVAKGMELLEPANWDVLAMILAFAFTMIISQKLMVQPTAGMDPDQAAIQKQTQQTMPIAITAMFFFIPLPAGVYIYMVLSNVVQSLQTWLIMRKPSPGFVDVLDEDRTEAGQPGNASDEKEEGGESPQKAVKLSSRKKPAKKKR
jgi:YidC/Oxa1 family membrane protein insertase